MQRVLLLVLLGGRCGPKVRRMVSLPARLSGLGIEIVCWLYQLIMRNQ